MRQSIIVVVRFLSRAFHFHLRDISGMPAGNFVKFGTNIHLDRFYVLVVKGSQRVIVTSCLSHYHGHHISGTPGRKELALKMI